MFFEQSVWHRVSFSVVESKESQLIHCPVKVPKPKDTEESGNDETQKKDEAEGQLPQTLVRIPTEHAPMLQQQPSAGGGSGE